MHTPFRTRQAILAILLASRALAADPADPARTVVQTPGFRLSNAADREDLSAAFRLSSSERRRAAREKAVAMGLPVELIGRDGRRRALVDFAGGQPRYLITHNANAAISTGANILQAAPYSLNGSGFTFGLWDGGAAYAQHQELAGRVTVKDGSSPDDHATHVAGTLAAFGARAAAKGMCPAAKIDSYDWDDDIAEMTSRAATYPGETGTIYISNQSYGYSSGWDYVGLSSHEWEWLGSGSSATSVDPDFGRYDSNARDNDTLAYAAPYFLMFRSAGNDREDNPVTGDKVALSATTTSYVSYNPATHPGGDGTYHGGFENIDSDALAKDIVTVGSVGDAVTSGVRDISQAYMSEYSSWGPTDDGRIKPDLVANGEELTSSVAESTTSYDVYSGTSMSSPNAAGSAMLLVQDYDKLHPGQAMRASTLKGLLIHTCDDLGNPGPDYRYGWGLVNVVRAAQLLQDQSTNPGKTRLSENVLNASFPSRALSFTWDGVSPIRATLCWTDPAASSTSGTDVRTSRLINNLNLRILGPDGTVYRPYVMPFVGTWTVASMDAPATTGVNNTDNVEQVDIPSPAQAGTYQVVVDYAGSLTNSQQIYSLLLNGSTAAAQPAPVPGTLSPTAVSGGANLTTFTLTGSNFQTGATVTLSKAGSNSVAAAGLRVVGESITGVINGSSVTLGVWDLTVTNPDGQSVTIPSAITVDGSLWTDNLENGITQWSHNATTGNDVWVYSTSNPHSATHCFRVPGPQSSLLDNLISPSIPVPGNGSELVFSFWHQYTFTTGDGSTIEISSDGGTNWKQIGSTGSGTSFTANGFNGTLPSGNPLSGQSGWTGTSGVYVQSSIALDSSIYNGKSIRFLFRMACNASQSSTGWYIDDLTLNGKLVTSTFSQWLAANFTDVSALSAQETADPDNDGLTNLAEYALGTNPNQFNTALSLKRETSGAVTLNFATSITTEGVTTHAEVSTDLVNWSEVPLTNTGTFSTSIVRQDMQATLPAGTGKGFVRLRFSQ